MTAPRLATALLAVGVLAAALGALVPPTLDRATPPAGAIDHGKGRPGYCPSDVGVTVVVDFQKLGGTTIVRCFPSGNRGTGLDALKGAGFQIAGVQRWGEAFICRIENRPSAVETVPVQGHSGYRETCIDTPPAAGYWSYWHAGNNCAWEYSQWGVKNRDFVPGGFEGWSFSLNATADTNPKPRIAAVRPGTAGGPCTAPDEPAPQTNNPSETQPRRPTTTEPPPSSRPSGGGSGRPSSPGSTDDGPSGPSAGGERGDGPSDDRPGRSTSEPDGPDREDPDDPTTTEAGGPGGGSGSSGDGGKGDSPRGGDGDEQASAADDPTDNVSFTGGEAARDVNDILREQSGASPWAPWVAVIAVAGLATGAALTARHRKRAREA